MKHSFRLPHRPLLGSIAALLLGSAAPVFAQISTWTGASSTDWNTSTNWSPNGAPNSASAVATFGTSTVTSVSISGATTANSIVFTASASAYTISAINTSPDNPTPLLISGTGIVNNSGITQNFALGSPASSTSAGINFQNFATAGSNTAYTIYGSTSGGYGAILAFSQTSMAGSAVITNTSATAGYGNGGTLIFYDSSTAGTATVTNNGATVGGGIGEGTTNFENSSTAGNAVIINNGATVSGLYGGETEFLNTSSAGNATLIANGGSNGREGGGILFVGQSTGGTARVILNGNGFLDISTLPIYISAPGSPAPATSVTVGSIEGSGNVFLGAYNLTAGSNNLSTTFSGVIQDGGTGGGVGGSLTKIGTGILTLTGTNSYTGGTTISGGLINFNSLANFGTGMITINGGGLQWATGTSIDISSRLTAGGSAGATFDTNGNNVTLASPLTGAGGLTKVGLGLLDLTGTSTYTGNTVVSAGSLWVDGSIASPSVTVNTGALLGGHGTIAGNLINNGFVSPGNSPGTLTVKGNYTQGSSGTLVIQVAGLAASQHDLLKVGGNASLAGTLQLQSLNGFKLTPGQEVTFLTTGGSVTGKFSTVQNLASFNGSALANTTVIYLPNAVELEAAQNSIYGELNGLPGLTGNDLQTAKILDGAASNPAAAKLFAVLNQANLSQLIKDVELIDPGQLAALSNIGSALSNQTLLSLAQRFDALQGSGAGGPAGPDGKGGKEVMPPPANNRWGTFVTGSGDFEHVDDTPASRGYNMGAGGVTLGVDYRFTDHLVAGIFGSYTNTGIDIANGGRINVDTGKWGLYGTYFDGGFYVNSALEGGYSAYENHRDALGGTARSSADGGDFSALFAPGYNWTMGGLTFGPTTRFQYAYESTGGFTETGSLAPMSIGNQHTESIVSGLGMKASYDWKIGSTIIRPELRLEWEHEYGDTSTNIDAGFAAVPGRTVTLASPTIGRDDLHLGAGFAVVFNDRFTAYAYYDGQFFRTNYEDSTVTGGVRVSF